MLFSLYVYVLVHVYVVCLVIRASVVYALFIVLLINQSSITHVGRNDTICTTIIYV